MSNQFKLQSSVQKPQSGENAEAGTIRTQDFDPLDFHVTFQLAFGREMTAEERRYFGVEKSVA
jgi:hypothetical protein